MGDDSEYEEKNDVLDMLLKPQLLGPYKSPWPTGSTWTNRLCPVAVEEEPGQTRLGDSVLEMWKGMEKHLPKKWVLLEVLEPNRQMSS